MKIRAQLESDILAAVCEYLAYKKVFFWRQNTMPPTQMVDGRRVFRRMPKWSMSGVPDIIAIGPAGRFLGIEVKRPGGRLSEAQMKFWEQCSTAGGMYCVVTSVDDMAKIII